MAQTGVLSEQELAERSGTSPERVRGLIKLGLLHSPEGQGQFTVFDINRVRLIEELANEGIELEGIARAVAAGKLSFGFLDHLLPRPVGLLPRTVDDLAAEMGLSVEALRSLYTHWGLAPPAPGERARADDATALEAMRVFPEQGLDADVLMAASRYFGENLRRIAESQVAFFVSTIIEPMVAAGRPGPEVLESVAPLSQALQPVAEGLIRWLHQRHFENYVMQETVLMLEESLAQAGLVRPRQGGEPAIAFLDLTGYTRQTETAGDEAAAQLASGLTDLVGPSCQQHGGRVVKLLGDGVMMHFRDPGRAVLCGLAMVEEAAKKDLPPARIGIHAGPVVFRDGDYFGTTVNIAARIADYARPTEVLVSESVSSMEGQESVGYAEIGPVQLKGLVDPIMLYRAARA
jgi:adenylate cyclase